MAASASTTIASALTARRGALAGKDADHQERQRADREDQLRQDRAERGKFGRGHFASSGRLDRRGASAPPAIAAW